jgi:hypothetical protein
MRNEVAGKDPDAREPYRPGSTGYFLAFGRPKTSRASPSGKLS